MTRELLKKRLEAAFLTRLEVPLFSFTNHHFFRPSPFASPLILALIRLHTNSGRIDVCNNNAVAVGIAMRSPPLSYKCL